MSTQRVGRFTIESVASRGPVSTVYRGRDDDSGRIVAVKAIRRELVEERALTPFRKMSEAVAKLRHPGLCAVIEVIESEKAVCVVSEWVDGKPLSALLKDGARPDGRNAWEILRQVLEALAFAHTKGAVHRDVKPANMLLRAGGALTLTDFGIALLRKEPGEAVQHFAPEQFAGGDIGPWTDIYHAGVLAYQLVTGKLPFTGTREEIAHRAVQERPSDPSSYDNKVAWQLDWVIQKALAKDPAERFGTATDFAEGLRLGLQDTVGRPLEPLGQAKPAPAAAPAIVATKAAAPAVAKAAPAAAPTKAAPLAPAATKAAPPAPAAAKPAAPPPAAAKLVEKAQALAKPAPAPAASPPTAAPPASTAPASSAPPAAKPASAEDKRVRVLFVDDDERLVNGLRALFKNDYKVFTASSGEMALDMAQKFDVQVVVSDQRMPGMSGVDLLRKVRILQPNAVRILLTGYSDLASLVGSVNEGEIFRFVKKPWDNDELRKTLADAAIIAAELAGSPKPQAVSPRTAGSLLVIDPSQSLARGLQRLLAGAAQVFAAGSVQDAVKVLEKQSVAAVIADLGAGRDGLVALFKQLKAKRPETLSILVTDEPDSELVVELINKAQIFRFLSKPVSAREIRSHVAEALRRHAAFKQAPTLVNQYRVEGGPRTAAEAQLAESVRPVSGDALASAA